MYEDRTQNYDRKFTKHIYGGKDLLKSQVLGSE